MVDAQIDSKSQQCDATRYVAGLPHRSNPSELTFTPFKIVNVSCCIAAAVEPPERWSSSR